MGTISRKGTIPVMQNWHESLQNVEIINELLSAFGRIQNSTTNQVMKFDGTEFVPVNCPAIKIGTFTRDEATATGTQAVTGVGFQPDVVLFLAAQDASLEVSFGLDDGTNHYSISYNNAAGKWETAPAVSIAMRETAVNLYYGNISSMDADGFTFSWTKANAPTGTIDVYYLAVKM